MDPNALIPTPEAIPAPPWVFIVLEQLLFLLHIIVINVVVGGLLILLFRRFSGRKEALPADQPASAKLPILIALGINFGIPPLLFLQVVFGHLFYTSSVLMATWWILIIPLLIVAYYGAYIHAIKYADVPGLSKAALVIATLILLYIGFMLVTNNSLMEQPERWTAYFGNRGGTLLNLGDPAFWPRYFHFIAASVAVGGLAFAIFYRMRKADDDTRELRVKQGLLIFAIATSVQVAIGFWYLLAIPSGLIPGFMGQDLLSTIVLMVGIAAGIGALIFGFLGKLTGAVVHLLITLVAMIVTRYNLRMMYLADNFEPGSLVISPQYGILALFLIILIIGVGSIIYMLKVSANNSGKEVTP